MFWEFLPEIAMVVTTVGIMVAILIVERETKRLGKEVVSALYRQSIYNDRLQEQIDRLFNHHFRLSEELYQKFKMLDERTKSLISAVEYPVNDDGGNEHVLGTDQGRDNDRNAPDAGGSLRQVHLDEDQDGRPIPAARFPQSDDSGATESPLGE